MDIARGAIIGDDLQWAATMLSHVVFAGVGGDEAKRMLALVYRHQGFREESGIMRNIYLSGAKELEDGITPLPAAGGRNTDLAATLSLKDWFDAFALRLNPERARGVTLVIDFVIGEEQVSLTVARQVEFARIGAAHPSPDARVKVSQAILERISSGDMTLDEALHGGLEISGDKSAFQLWLDLHDTFDLWFDIVTP